MNGDIATIRITVAAAMPVQIHGTLITYRKPAASSLRRPSWAAGWIVRGRASQSAAADTTNDTPSIPHTTVGPAVPYRAAAIAGPTIALPLRAMPSHEFADGRTGCSTTSGTMPPNAGWKNPSARPKHTASAKMLARLRWPVASIVKNTSITAARARSEPIIRSRRE